MQDSHLGSQPAAGEEEAFRRFDLLGKSEVFRATLGLIAKIARSQATALIEGETGTGKELVARAIHYLGSRSTQPFLPVNCGALPDNLVENELFGHARGAYTDARDVHRGLVADADGGTLFLDEIEALSARAQVALLRFLQDGLYRPLGAKRDQRVDVRVIAASNVRLSDLAAAGRFRSDLLYRLDVMRVPIPPLRKRGQDVVLLAEHFLRRFARQYGNPAPALGSEEVVALLSHSWPGNVRELENVVHRAFLLAESGRTHFDIGEREEDAFGPRTKPDSDGHPDATLNLSCAKAALVRGLERSILLRAMQASQGNVTAAARLCGKERRAFGKLLKKHGIGKLNGDPPTVTGRF